MESGRVPEMWDPGEYQEGKIRASTKKVGSERVSDQIVSLAKHTT